MRLLDTKTGQFVDKDPTKTKYAILSHTWDKGGEQTYEELKKIQQRYPPEPPHAPQSRPSDPNGGVSSSPEQGHGNPPATPRPSQAPRDSPPATAPLQSPSSSPDRGRSEPSPIQHPSQHPRNSPSVTTSFMESSKPSKSWFAQRMGRFKKWCQRHSIRNAHQTNSEPQTIWEDPDLSPKIRDACKVARDNGYDYIWIDSCCIDKSSSSELSEAINSMYQWYGLAAMCYAYLAGVPPKDDHHANRSPFRRSQWFRRGWTLQELIAPSRVEFLSEDWSPIGSKHDLVNLVESITKIHSKALLRLEPLDVFSVAQRLSWAADRETTRKEDRAYSLLGIFDINMPTLYGEGERAFRRLQEQIMLRIPDQSLFAWGTIRLPDSQLPPDATRTQSPHTFQAETRDLRPRSPPAQLLYNFRDSSQIKLPASHRERIEYTPTPHGIRTELQMIPLTRDLLSRILGYSDVELQLPEKYRWYLAILGCEHASYPGHLLGRVYAILPSESGVDLVYTGRIRPISGSQSSAPPPDLFLVSPATMKHYGPTERKTVYIPHLGRADQILNLREQPYPAIKLALLEDTSRALHSRGYSANLYDLVSDRPTTHCLTLSKDDYTVTVKFEHTLEDDGKRFTMTAEVTLGPRTQLDYAPSADQADRRTMRWGDGCPWDTRLKPESVRLKAAVWSLAVDLHLEFAGTGVYFIRIDVRSDTGEPESVSSAAGPGARGIVANLLSRPLSFLDIALWG